MFKTPLTLIAIAFCIHIGSSQDLINRIRHNIPADISYAPNIIADQIYHKNDLKTIDLFSLSSDKSTTIDGVQLNINTKHIESLHQKDDYAISIPISDQYSVDLKLYPSDDITSAGYTLYDAERNELKPSRISFYKGVVADDPRSMVQLTVTDSDIRAVIIDAQGIYNLGPMTGNDDYILFNDQELGDLPFECGTGTGEHIQLEDFPEMEGVSLQKSGQCVKVHVEVDHRSFQNFGQNIQAAEQFALASFAQVAVLFEYLYENSPNSIPIEVSSVRIWTGPDSYGAESNVGNALPTLANSVNPTSFNADLVHLISAENRNSYSGIAYVSCRGSGPCKATTIGTNVPFAVSQTAMTFAGVPNYSWTINVLAHEMGHNMGAPHTQACAWGNNNNTAIDGCFTIEGSCSDPGFPSGPGSIMSYCHFAGRPGISFDLAFGAEVGDHIYDEYLFAAQFLTNCVSGPPPPPEIFCENSLSITEDIIVDFESTDLSIWTNAVDDDLDWTINTGSTPSSNTGPDQANDGSSYFYVEASSPNFPAKTARLISDCIDLSQLTDPVFTFLFHMYGEGMGSLALTIHQEENSTLLATIAGDQGNQWFTATVDMRDYQDEVIQIELLAETGNNWTSDIAIDRLEIKGTPPPAPEGDNICDDPLAENFGLAGSCEYSCDDIATSTVTPDNVNSNIIANSSISTEIPGPVGVDALDRVYWRVNGTVELNQGFSVAAGSELFIDIGSCLE